MKTALLLIDIQNDYFPGGAMQLVNSVEAGEQAGLLLNSFRSKKLSVIHIQHISTRPDATFFLPGTVGAKIYSCVQPIDCEPVFIKNYPNSFRETGLLEYLKENEIKNLVIAGMMTHMCVDTTVRAAFDLGFSCIIAYDACATKNLIFMGNTIEADKVQQSFLAALNGLFAKIDSAENICAVF